MTIAKTLISTIDVTLSLLVAIMCGLAYCAASEDGTVRLWDALSGACVRVLECTYAGKLCALPGARLAVASEQLVILDLAAETIEHIIPDAGDGAKISTLKIYPTGGLVTVGGEDPDMVIKVWGALPSPMLRPLHTVYTSVVTDVAVLADGRIVTMWDGARG